MPQKGGDQVDASGGAAEQALNVALLRSTSATACGAALLGLAGMIIQNEIAWYYNTVAQFGPLCPDLRSESCDPRETAHMWPITNQLILLDATRAVLITLPTLVAFFFVYRFYGAQLALEQSKNRQPASATLLTVPHLRWRLGLELIVLAVHVFPRVEALSDPPDLYLFLSQVSLLSAAALPAVVPATLSLAPPPLLVRSSCLFACCSSSESCATAAALTRAAGALSGAA